MRIAGAFLVSCLTCLCAAEAQAPDPVALYAEAQKKLETPGSGREAIPLLRQANEAWQKAGDTSDRYVESLDTLGLLVWETSAPGSTEWRAETRSLATQAVTIQEKRSDHPELLALSLELQAEAIGSPDPAAETAWKRANAIRAERVAAIQAESAANSAAEIPEKMGPGTQPPVLTSKVEPVYTRFALFRKQQGDVMLSLVIGKDGVPRDFKLVRSLGYGLDEQAAIAVSKWRFRPGEKNGTPATVPANIQVHFRLLDKAPTP